MFVKMGQEDAQTLRAQIGLGNMLAISGGRITLRDGTVVLPVSNGYDVEIDLQADDMYTVRRIFRRAGNRWVKGQRTNVFVDEISEAAYYASCFRSHDAETWPHKV